MESVEEMALSDKHIQKISEYLKSLGWSDSEILRFIEYITA